MSKVKQIGYDVGGGQLPVSRHLTIIDHMPLAEARTWWGKGDAFRYVRKDVRAAGWATGLEESAQYVLCSRLIRYLETDTGMVPTQTQNPEAYHRFADEISKLVSPGGVLVLFDFTHLVMEVVKRFRLYAEVCNWWIVCPPELITRGEGHWPAESRVVFVRNPLWEE